MKPLVSSHNNMAHSISSRLKSPNTIHILISWTIFCVLYVFAAIYKPFQVDELFSWVYAERFSFMDIILLKEFGIGHPPLYHIIQKTIQLIFQNYNSIHVRLENLFTGSLFIILLSSHLLKHRKAPLLCYALSASATLLDVFVFSRMYGLVCLSSVLLLRFGEEYCENPRPKYLISIAFSCILGFLSDYNFILLMPYVLLVLSSEKRYKKRIMFYLMVFSILCWLISGLVSIAIQKQPLIDYFNTAISDISMTAYNLGNMLIDFAFKEVFILALSIVGIVIFLTARKKIFKPFQMQKKPISTSLQLAIFLLVSVLLGVLAAFQYIQIRYAIIIALLIVILRNFKEITLFNSDPVKERLFFSLFSGIFILLSISPYLWRDLRSTRFLYIFIPSVMYLILMIFDKKALIAFSIVSIVSGIFWLQSYRLAGGYLPPAVDEKTPVIFQDAHAYSTHYLKNDHISAIPLFFEQKSFRFYCKICTMGTRDIDYKKYKAFRVVGTYDFDIASNIPKGFKLVKKENYLSWLDELQFQYLTPLLIWRYSIFEFEALD